MIRLENDLFRVVTHETLAENFMIKLGERPIVVLNGGGIKRGQLGNLDICLDTGKELIRLDRLFHRPRGYYDWSRYMRGMSLNRWQVEDYFAAIGFRKQILREASRGKRDAEVGGRAMLCVGVVVYPNLNREMVFYVNDNRHLNPAPMRISSLYLTNDVVDMSMQKKKVLRWAHTEIGNAWIHPLLPREEYPTLGDLAPTGLAKMRIALTRLGFEPLAADLAFADRLGF